MQFVKILNYIAKICPSFKRYNMLLYENQDQQVI
jgi:hypothetical protein